MKTSIREDVSLKLQSLIVDHQVAAERHVSSEHCLKTGRWRGPPRINTVNSINCFFIQSWRQREFVHSKSERFRKIELLPLLTNNSSTIPQTAPLKWLSVTSHWTDRPRWSKLPLCSRTSSEPRDLTWSDSLNQDEMRRPESFWLQNYEDNKKTKQK